MKVVDTPRCAVGAISVWPLRLLTGSETGYIHLYDIREGCRRQVKTGSKHQKHPQKHRGKRFLRELPGEYPGSEAIRSTSPVPATPAAPASRSAKGSPALWGQ